MVGYINGDMGLFNELVYTIVEAGSEIISEIIGKITGKKNNRLELIDRWPN